MHMCLCVCAHMYVLVEVKGQLIGVGSLPPSVSRSQGLNSGRPTWQPVPSPAEPSQQSDSPDFHFQS